MKNKADKCKHSFSSWQLLVDGAGTPILDMSNSLREWATCAECGMAIDRIVLQVEQEKL